MKAEPIVLILPIASRRFAYFITRTGYASFRDIEAAKRRAQENPAIRIARTGLTRVPFAEMSQAEAQHFARESELDVKVDVPDEIRDMAEALRSATAEKPAETIGGVPVKHGSYAIQLLREKIEEAIIPIFWDEVNGFLETPIPLEMRDV
jgi:hypothetical protein